MAGKSHKVCSFLLLLWVFCTSVKGEPSTGNNHWKDLPSSLAKKLLEQSENHNNLNDVDSSEKYEFEKRMPPLPFDKRMPPLPFDKRMPPLPFDKRMPPLPFDKRMPPLPFDKRMPPLPFDKRMPPLPFDKRMAVERKRKPVLENDVGFNIKPDESDFMEPEGFEGREYGMEKGHDANSIFEKRMPPLPFDKRMPPLPFDKRSVAKWYNLQAAANGRNKRMVSEHSDPNSIARAKSAITG